jgi:NADPH:quinone reductase-like Zn-dependent oxidoreductase
MRAVLIRDHGVVLGEAADPVAGPGEVLVRIAASGLNPADLMQIRGGYPAPAPWPQDIPGMEFAGTIEELGEGVEGWQTGERVMALVGGGAHAEAIAVPTGLLMRVPDHIELTDAAGFPEAFTTAWDALVIQGALTAGDRVLVTGSTGGVGTAAVQIATAAGADVVAVVRREEQGEQLASIAPATAVTLADRIAEHGPFDVVLELVGGPGLDERVGQLATGGRIVVIGTSAGSDMALSLGALMRARGSIRASTLRSRPRWEKDTLAQALSRHLVPRLADGRITVPIDSRFPLADAAAAYERLAESGKFGKVVLAG